MGSRGWRAGLRSCRVEVECGVESRMSAHVSFGRSESVRFYSTVQEVRLRISTACDMQALQRASVWECGVFLEILTIMPCFLYIIMGFHSMDVYLQDDGRQRVHPGPQAQLKPKNLTRILPAFAP